MKVKILLSAVIATLGFAGLNAAQASDGTVNFTGTVVATTCTVAPASVTQTVALPQVSVTALTGAGTTAGATAFNIGLAACTAGSKARIQFEAGPNVDPVTGNLKITSAAPATNVQIQLVNQAGGAINMATNVNQVTANDATLTAGVNTFYYTAQYISSATAVAGSANTSVTWSIAYN
ncbi:fimbrial protein [Solimicrobium silvestre]|uniref:P pilus assembly protein pilin FimA n=1 Tax=Solimicrobium silvestre TaxID=2099400 RepID=A0A2S9H040_9BURK|nr:fimbrial protein [Solimicrobium silvestre]PRC93352.1 P pilus assembly protein pilin FimA [Solimicrobium silvestre]